MTNILDTIKFASAGNVTSGNRPMTNQIPTSKSYLTMNPTPGTWGNLYDFGFTETMRDVLGMNTSAEVTSKTNNPLIIQQNQQKNLQNLQKQGVNYEEAYRRVYGTQPPSPTQQNMSSAQKKAQEFSQIGGNPNDVSQLFHERSMGANVGDIRNFNGSNWRWNGKEWEKQDSGGGSNKPDIQSVISDVANKIQRSGMENLYDEETFNKIINDVYHRGISAADAIEARGRESAEARWKAIRENLAAQKAETGVEARRQRELAMQEGEMYGKQIEGRRDRELTDISKQKEGAEKDYLTIKDDLGRAFVDTSRKLQAILRGSGVASSGFAMGEETKMLRDFNKNLDVMAVKHKGTLDALDQAFRETTSIYNDKLTQLDFETRKIISNIDSWERNTIAQIQASERINLADKLERINDAINRADQVRLQAENQYSQQKLAMAQWQFDMQQRMALAAQAAAQGRIDSAQKTIAEMRAIANEAFNRVAFGKWTRNPEGGWDLSAPTVSGFIKLNQGESYTDEEKERIEKFKMQPTQQDIFSRYGINK